MTKKDYIRLARALQEARETAQDTVKVACRAAADDTIAIAARAVADALRDDNANFDRARFLAACGVQ